MQHKTKVIVVCSSLYPDRTGGIEIYNYNFIKWLKNNSNYQPVALVGGSGDGLDGIEVVRLNNSPKKIFAWIISLFNVLKNTRNTKRIVHFSFARSNGLYWFFYSKICKLFNVPYIIYIRGGGLFPWKPAFIFKSAFNGAERLICVGEQQKEEYEKRVNRSIEVVPNIRPFVKSDMTSQEVRQSYDLPLDALLILVLGSIKSIKGTDIIIKAFNNINLEFIKNNNIHIVFAGSGNIDEYKPMIESDRSDNLHFLGNVPFDKVCHLFKAADVYLLASRFEGMPGSLIEALFNGCPCISSNIAFTRKTLTDGKNCLIFKNEDIDGLRSCIELIVKNKELREQLGTGASECYAMNWKADMSFNRVVEIYDEIFLSRENESIK